MRSQEEIDSFRQSFQAWLDGISGELSFWDRWFSTKGLSWPNEYLFRTGNEPKFALEWLCNKLNLWPARVLDVGAGPISSVGIRSSRGKIDVFACDPLALPYDQLLNKYFINPYVRTDFAFSEKLLDVYETNQFNLVHMQNALDHSFFPLVAIQQMLSVCKPNGAILLVHCENEAENERYQGFHQWNLTKEAGDFIIWRPDARFNITELFKEQAIVDVEREVGDKRNIIRATLIKTISGNVNIIKNVNNIYDLVLLQEVISLKECPVNASNSTEEFLNKVQKVARGRSVYIWGAGAGGIKTYDMLKQAGIEIVGFLDSDVNKVGSVLEGYSIVSAAELNGQQNMVMVVVGSSFFQDISQVLLHMGYSENEDYLVNPDL